MAWRPVPSGGAGQRPRPQAYELWVILRLQRSGRQMRGLSRWSRRGVLAEPDRRLRSSVRAARLINLRTGRSGARSTRLAPATIAPCAACIASSSDGGNPPSGHPAQCSVWILPYPPFSASTSACASAESHFAAPSTAATSHPSLSMTRVTGSPSALPSLCRVSKASPLESR